MAYCVKSDFNMATQFDRTEALIGSEALGKIRRASVIVFGTGGVGSYVIEGLARAGIGSLTIVDGDTVDITNINRQLPALNSTLGMPKARVMAERVRDINPDCKVKADVRFFTADNADDFSFAEYDYIVDAIDMVSSKVLIISKARDAGVPVISSMGTGNKLDPTLFRIAPIEKTDTCPLARVMRRKLKDLGITGVKVLYSTENPRPTTVGENGNAPASISFVPSVAGLIIAGEVIKDITGE